MKLSFGEILEVVGSKDLLTIFGNDTKANSQQSIYYQVWFEKMQGGSRYLKLLLRYFSDFWKFVALILSSKLKQVSW